MSNTTTETTTETTVKLTPDNTAVIEQNLGNKAVPEGTAPVESAPKKQKAIKKTAPATKEVPPPEEKEQQPTVPTEDKAVVNTAINKAPQLGNFVPMNPAGGGMDVRVTHAQAAHNKMDTFTKGLCYGAGFAVAVTAVALVARAVCGGSEE